jgi:hypothetical protein
MKGTFKPMQAGWRMRREEIIWAAGLFEGEGSFAAGMSVHKRNKKPRLGMRMTTTDRDVAERFMKAVGVGTIRVRPQTGLGTKDVHEWGTGGFHRTQYLVAMFWPWLGTRRRARALEVLALVR